MSATDEPPPGRGGSARPAVAALPPERLLPDTQPVYVASWIYVFGVLTLAAFVVVLVSGAVIALAGPALVAHLVASATSCNSMHLWSTELFFFFMVVHLWGKFFMAAWRGRRALTWITGAIVVPRLDRRPPSPATSPSRTSTRSGSAAQAKDGLNASGVGAFFNVLNFGQMLLWHVVLLPLVVGAADRRPRPARPPARRRAAAARSDGGERRERRRLPARARPGASSGRARSGATTSSRRR